MELSAYRTEDTKKICQLFMESFSDSEGDSEGAAIKTLAYNLMTMTDSADLAAFVATEDTEIIGCIIFSRLRFATPVTAFVLAPVAVHTRHQDRGVGQALIRFGLNRLRDSGVELVFTYGDPMFYTKVGFTPVREEDFTAPFTLTYPDGWLAQSLVDSSLTPITGASRCVEALHKPEYW